jgi:hypothetical protein
VKKMCAWLVVLGACAGDADPPWQLDHDRIVAVRVSPPHLPSGARGTVDALIARAGDTTVVSPPIGVQAAVAVPGLEGAVQPDGSIVAPDEAHLAIARQALHLEAGAPVPLQIGAAFGAQPLIGTKVVWLGDTGDNPAMPAVTVNGAAPGDALVIAPDVDVPMSVDADPMWKVTWLTSCGTLHDDDEHAAFVHVLPDDPMAGELAVVVRDVTGGVVWRTWPIRAAAP